MRLLSLAANNHAEILKEIEKKLGSKLELLLLFGAESGADFKASNISQMNLRRPIGTKHIMQNDEYRGLLHSVGFSHDIEADAMEFIDHLNRRDKRYRYFSHKLETIHDYMDYYHIMFDVVSKIIIENKITHVLFFNIPHLAYDTLIYHIAQRLKLDILILNQSIFENKFFSLRNVVDFGSINKNNASNEYPPIVIDSKKKLEHFYMKKIKQEKDTTGKMSFKAIYLYFLYVVLKEPTLLLKPKKIYNYLIRINKVYKALPKWRDPFASYFHKSRLEYFEHIIEYENNDYDLDIPFVYFAMQLQPEMTTSALGGWFRDQALAIEYLADLLPQDVMIYVKENPKQGAFMRGPLFFHRLNRIKNVKILPSYANTHQLMEKSLFVSTITGTVGWEAIREKKNVLVFGNPWYKSLPGVFAYNDKLTYNDIIDYKIDHSELEKSLGILMGLSHDGVVDRHYKKIAKNYDKIKNLDMVSDTIIDLLLYRKDVTFKQ